MLDAALWLKRAAQEFVSKILLRSAPRARSDDENLDAIFDGRVIPARRLRALLGILSLPLLHCATAGEDLQPDSPFGFFNRAFQP